MVVGTVDLQSGDSEGGKVGVGSISQTIARVAVLTLRVGSSEDAGDSQEGGDQELSVEEHQGSGQQNVKYTEDGWGSELRKDTLVHPGFLTGSRNPLCTPTAYDIFVQRGHCIEG